MEVLQLRIFFKDLINLFLKRGSEGERDGENHQCVVASRVPCTGDKVHNPGMCPTLGIELVILWLCRLALNPLSHTSHGYN